MSSHLLPNLIIGGAPRAGTTSLFNYLSYHPEICCSSRKETNYFLPLRFGEKRAPIGEYLQYFDHCSGARYLLEASPAYLYGGMAIAAEIKEKLGDIKIIFSLRDPIKRAFSFYNYKKSRIEIDQDMTFWQYIQNWERLDATARRKQENTKYWGIEGGFYVDYLNEWFEVSAESMRIVFFEQLKDNPRIVLQELCEWLCVDYTVLQQRKVLSVHNRAVNYRNTVLQKIALLVNRQGEMFWRTYPFAKRTVRRIYYAINGRDFERTIPEDARVYLETLFRPHNRRLAVELSRRGYTNLPYWLPIER